MEQLGELQDVQAEIEAQGFRVIAVSSDPAEDTAEWLAFARLPFPLLADPGCEVIRQFGVYDRLHDMALPSVLLIDPDGRVAWKHVGTDITDRPEADALLNEVRRQAQKIAGQRRKGGVS